jgi:gentisate 1,2-dioxygenase
MKSMTSELYLLPEGKIIIAHSDKRLSIGYLVLNPGKELPKHNRPVLEELRQISGKCVMKLYDGDKIREVTLNENDRLEIPTLQYHIHSNPFSDLSYTLWIAHGDITPIIESIRKNKEM